MTIPYSTIISTPIGKLGVRVQDQALSKIDFLTADAELSPLEMPSNKLSAQIADQLQSYFINPTTKFTIPIVTSGTAFQQKVWQTLRAIPVSQTLTYGQLAQLLNTSARAIGNACRANPVPIVTPCHRIVAANSLGGFAGAQSGILLDIKSWLLQHESSALHLS